MGLGHRSEGKRRAATAVTGSYPAGRAATRYSPARDPTRQARHVGRAQALSGVADRLSAAYFLSRGPPPFAPGFGADVAPASGSNESTV